MLLRAAFWIGLVALLMPHEPDLGFGRPGPQNVATDAMTVVESAASSPQQFCNGHEALCRDGTTAVQLLRSTVLQRLAQIKADIQAQQRLRVR